MFLFNEVCPKSQVKTKGSRRISFVQFLKALEYIAEKKVKSLIEYGLECCNQSDSVCG